MILTTTPAGENFQIARVGGKDEVHSHLATLGFVGGVNVSVVNGLNGNAIIHIEDTWTALDKSLSNHVHVK